MRAAPKVKYIAVAFTGVDHVDLSACRARGIAVSNAAGYSTNAVAELVFGLAIGLYRSIPACDQRARTGGTKDGLVGPELHGKTMGIVGTGAIGRRVAAIASAFGCKLLAYSRTEREEMKALGAEYVTLEELMERSDIVSLHVPVTDGTRGLIGRELLEKMKKSAILINTARGPVVDNAALAEALENGSIAGAGIDVFDMEPPIPGDYPLLTAPPHHPDAPTGLRHGRGYGNPGGYHHFQHRALDCRGSDQCDTFRELNGESDDTVSGAGGKAALPPALGGSFSRGHTGISGQLF